MDNLLRVSGECQSPNLDRRSLDGPSIPALVGPSKRLELAQELGKARICADLNLNQPSSITI